MARAAGDSATYRWVLQRKDTGEYFPDPATDVELPSVTTIIHKVLAAPALVGWAYRTTRDNISAYVSFVKNDDNLKNTDVMDMVDTFSDSDMLEEFLKDNSLRPDDVRDEAAARGRAEHSHLETLCGLDPDSAMDCAYGMIEEGGYAKAIGQWWTDKVPTVVASEVVLRSLTHQFAGSVDMVYRNATHPLSVTDLKTRKEDATAYASDFFQIDGYDIAWNEMNPKNQAHRKTVLVARADGTYREVESKLEDGAFLKLLDIYNVMKEVGL